LRTREAKEGRVKIDAVHPAEHESIWIVEAMRVQFVSPSFEGEFMYSSKQAALIGEEIQRHRGQLLTKGESIG
jgi:hypothetical protein